MAESAAHGRLARGLRPFELTLAALLALALLVAAVRTMTPLFAFAERESMRAALNEMRSGLMLAALVALTRGDHEALAALGHANPATLTPAGPTRYAGEHRDVDASRVSGAYWYFDPEQHLLGYRVDATEVFEGGAEAPTRARFRVGLRYQDSDGDGRYTPGVDTFTGVALDPLEPWRWR